MSSRRYTDEFKIEAVKQVTERGYSQREVAARLGVTSASLSAWVKKFGPGTKHASQVDDQQDEIRRLKAELKRVTEERDILKKATAYFAKESQ
jgi:transposase-like protein